MKGMEEKISDKKLKIRIIVTFGLVEVVVQSNSFDHKSHKHQQYIYCVRKTQSTVSSCYLRYQAHKSMKLMKETIVFSNNAINIKLNDRCFA